MWEYVIGGATVFGLIVTIASIYNGRVTRREIIEAMAREEALTRELIAREEALTRELMAKMYEGFEALVKQSAEEHKAILEAIRSASAKR